VSQFEFGRRWCDFSLSFTHACVGFQLWILSQDGQNIGNEISGNVSKRTISVVNPVGTAIPVIGQWIIISGIEIGLPASDGLSEAF
jgi:hypothetical protein